MATRPAACGMLRPHCVRQGSGRQGLRHPITVTPTLPRAPSLRSLTLDCSRCEGPHHSGRAIVTRTTRFQVDRKHSCSWNYFLPVIAVLRQFLHLLFPLASLPFLFCCYVCMFLLFLKQFLLPYSVPCSFVSTCLLHFFSFSYFSYSIVNFIEFFV